MIYPGGGSNIESSRTQETRSSSWMVVTLSTFSSNPNIFPKVILAVKTCMRGISEK